MEPQIGGIELYVCKYKYVDMCAIVKSPEHLACGVARDYGPASHVQSIVTYGRGITVWVSFSRVFDPLHHR